MAEISIPQFDLNSTLDYSKLKDALASELETLDTANEAFAKLGRHTLDATFRTVSPQAHAAIRDLRSHLEDRGAVVLRNTEITGTDVEVAQLQAISLAGVFGAPTKTDRRDGQIAWPIHYDPDTKLTRTFSQALGEAAFHTDTQYYQNPEKYFGLFCIVADEFGKGTSQLIDGNSAIEAFEGEYGLPLRQELERPYPFRVPSVFTEHASDCEIEITWAPIFSLPEKTIRYRKDTIMRALECSGVTISTGQEEALTKFDDLLVQLPTTDYHLLPGDAILVNNHTMLHARTAFDNPDRFLYRVRMDDETSI